MEKKKAALILAAIGALVTASALRADEVPEAFPQEKVAEFEAFVLGVAKSPPTRGAPPTIPRIRNRVRELGMPKDVYVAAVERVADGLVAETFVHTNYSGKTEVWLKWDLVPLNLINFMGALGDPEFLPWLEQQATGSELSRIREYAATSYVKIAGLDAVPFVRKILSGSDERYGLSCKYLVSKEFFDQIAKSEAAKAPQEKIDDAYGMLVDQAQTVAYVGHADEIDKFLCERLQGYRASVQRERVVERFLNSANEIARTNFKKKQDEIQKTLKTERVDLSNRFPGLAVPEALEDASKETSGSEKKSPEEVK